MRVLMAGYSFALVLFVIGCLVIDRSAPGLSGIRSLMRAFGMAFSGVLLVMSRPLLPPLFSIVIGNMALYTSYVLIHRAINEILGVKKLYLSFSFLVGILTSWALFHYAVIHPNMAARIAIITAATGLQALLISTVLFRCRHITLRGPAKVVGWMAISVSALHVVRIGLTFVWPPSPDLMHPDLFQSIFILINSIIALGFGFSLIWLALFTQRTRLQTLAITDGLTGLLNRRAFEEALQRELAWSQRHGNATGVVLIDLDYFKSINDTYGHAAGDEVLRRVSAVLPVGLRGSDAVARFGGEEFILMLRNANLLQTNMIAERIRQQVEVLRNLPGPSKITVSIGVAVSSAADTVESLLKKTDDALYRSKRAGRNTVSCHGDLAVDFLTAMQPHTELSSIGD
jgi:diguanylate cyclase (GGDEF)-like protein